MSELAQFNRLLHKLSFFKDDSSGSPSELATIIGNLRVEVEFLQQAERLGQVDEDVLLSLCQQLDGFVRKGQNIFEGNVNPKAEEWVLNLIGADAAITLLIMMLDSSAPQQVLEENVFLFLTTGYLEHRGVHQKTPSEEYFPQI